MSELESPQIDDNKKVPSRVEAIIRRILKITFKVLKWPVIIVVVWNIAAIPFYFFDRFLLIGDTDENHKNNIFRLLQREAEYNAYVNKYLDGVTRESIKIRIRRKIVGKYIINRTFDITNGKSDRDLTFVNCCGVSFVHSLGTPFGVYSPNERLYAFIESILFSPVFRYTIIYNDHTDNVYHDKLANRNSPFRLVPGYVNVHAWYTASGIRFGEYRRSGVPAGMAPAKTR